MYLHLVNFAECDPETPDLIATGTEMARSQKSEVKGFLPRGWSKGIGTAPGQNATAFKPSQISHFNDDGALAMISR